MSSFETLDSDFKSDLGCPGVGRLLWLKAFAKVSVRSASEMRTGTSEAAGLGSRSSARHDGDADGFVRPGAVVSLDGFKKSFQQHVPKGVEAIAREVFEHCIWYFLRPSGAPVVTVTDEHEMVSLADLMDEFVDSAMTSSRIEVKGQKFDMLNLRLKATARNSVPRLHWCAASRVVIEGNLSGKVPGLHGRLTDDAPGEFVYACYLSSDYLDERVRSDRTAFDISDRIPGQPLVDDLSLDDIREAVLEEVAKILKDPLESAREQGNQRVHEFVTKRAPRYRPLLAKIEERGMVDAKRPSVSYSDRLSSYFMPCGPIAVACVTVSGAVLHHEKRAWRLRSRDPGAPRRPAAGRALDTLSYRLGPSLEPPPRAWRARRTRVPGLRDCWCRSWAESRHSALKARQTRGKRMEGPGDRTANRAPQQDRARPVGL